MFAALDSRLALIARIRAQSRESERVVRLIVETFSLGLSYRRVLFFTRVQGDLLIAAGAGADAEALIGRKMPVPQKPDDPFRRVLERGRTVCVEGRGPEIEVPPWFDEVLGAQRFHLFPVVAGGSVQGLLYGEERTARGPLDATEQVYIDRLSEELGMTVMASG